MPSTRHLMIDLETLSAEPTAAVIAIGAVTFTEDEIISQFEAQIDPVWTPGHRSVSTMDWWNKQEAGVRARMFSGRMPPDVICRRFSDYLGASQPSFVWANAPTFDLVIIRHFYKQAGLEFPLSHRIERCYRTLLAVAQDRGYVKPESSEGRHDALADALYQARVTRDILRGFRAFGFSIVR